MISVLVPSYNHRSYIQAALASVQAQTFADLEIVIVDDGSTDGSPLLISEILDSQAWRLRFPNRTKFITAAANRGAPETINLAASQASGELLAILNSDDVFFRDRLRTLAELVHSGCELTFSRSIFIEDNGKRIAELDPRVRHFWEAQNRIRYYPTVGFAFLQSNVALSTGNFLMTHDLFDELGGMSALEYCHDWDFCLRAVLRTEPAFCDEPLYAYRVHGANSFHSLEHLSDMESNAARRSFLREQWAARNPLAPTPNRWPGIYEAVTEWIGGY